MNGNQITELFTYHPPQSHQTARYDEIRKKALEFAMVIHDLTPESPEQTLAIRSLHLATMQANAAIAINEAQNGPA